MSERDEIIGSGLGDDALESGWEDLEQPPEDEAAEQPPGQGASGDGTDADGDAGGSGGRGRARSVAVVTGRAASGLIAIGIAVAVVGGLSLAPLPTITAEGHSEALTPTAMGRMLVCPSSALLLGNNPTADTLSLSSLGTPTRQVYGSEVSSAELDTDDVTGALIAPRSYQRPPSADNAAALAVAQSQRASANRLAGFTATACTPAEHSQWLLGGSTAVGRTTLILLANPGEVSANVMLTAYSEHGEGGASSVITVPPGTQRTVSLASFARDIDAPVVHVASTGAAVSAFLQHSVQRGLESGGVDLVAAAESTLTDIVIPGVRIRGAEAVLAASAEEGFIDLAPVLRMMSTWSEPTMVQVRVIGEVGTEYALETQVELEPSTVAEFSLSEVPDGNYTVTVTAPTTVLAGVRVSALTGEGTASELGWFPAAALLDGEVAVAVAAGPQPMIALTAHPRGGGDVRITGPDGSSSVYPVSPDAVTMVPVQPGGYLLSGLDRTAVAVSYAGNGRLAAYTALAGDRAAGAVQVHFSQQRQ